MFQANMFTLFKTSYINKLNSYKIKFNYNTLTKLIISSLLFYEIVTDIKYCIDFIDLYYKIKAIKYLSFITL